MSDSEGSSLSLSVVDFLQSMSAKKFSYVKHNVGITEEALYLGEVTSLGYLLFLNRDTTNYVELRVSTGSTKFATVKPALSTTAPGVFLGFVGSGVTAPYAIASTVACQCEYVVFSQ